MGCEKPAVWKLRRNFHTGDAEMQYILAVDNLLYDNVSMAVTWLIRAVAHDHALANDYVERL